MSAESKFPVSEVFHSIQGEGQRAGRPSLFVRLSGCNLRCWWCDTPYTSWKPEMTPVDAGDIAMRVFDCKAADVVFTGGEPMLYAAKLAPLVAGLRETGKFVTIETNGTIYDDAVQPDLWSVSPKLASSTPAIGRGQSGSDTADLVARDLHVRNLDNGSLYQFSGTAAARQFKFVVTGHDDLAEVDALVVAHVLAPADVWMMPEARSRDEVLAKASWLADACKDRNYNLTLRLHTLMWGQKRGV